MKFGHYLVFQCSYNFFLPKKGVLNLLLPATYSLLEEDSKHILALRGSTSSSVESPGLRNLL